MSLLINLTCVALAIYILKNLIKLFFTLFTGAAISVFGYKIAKDAKSEKSVN